MKNFIIFQEVKQFQKGGFSKVIIANLRENPYLEEAHQK